MCVRALTFRLLNSTKFFFKTSRRNANAPTLRSRHLVRPSVREIARNVFQIGKISLHRTHLPWNHYEIIMCLLDNFTVCRFVYLCLCVKRVPSVTSALRTFDFDSFILTTQTFRACYTSNCRHRYPLTNLNVRFLSERNQCSEISFVSTNCHSMP